MKKTLLALALCTSATMMWAETEFEAKLASVGINPAECIDLSADSYISIEEPSLAYINLSEASGSPYQAVLDYYDNNGNYFQKRVIIGLQGNSELAKRNFAIELCEDEWIGDETTSMTFGSWPAQDEFHLKGFYEDGLRGTAEVAYQIYGQISGRQNCYPKAFPVLLYISGDFYGIMAWQLKKHRDNMGLDKKNSANIWLDGKLTNKNIWNGEIDWTDFEVRNPKDLYTMDGSDYDGDAPQELMDETSEFYTGKNKQVRCAEAKQHIIELSKYYQTLSDAEVSGASADEMKAMIAQRFDVEQIINYRIFSLITNNYDGFGKNWQWFTYDGQQWTVAPYDCNLTFGYNDATDEDGNRIYTLWEANQGSKKYDYKMENTATDGPMLWINNYYMDQLKSRYAELRKAEIISTNTIMNLFESWSNRIGDVNYDEERKLWPDSPFLFGINENLGRVHDWVEQRIALEDDFLGYVDPSGIENVKHQTEAVKGIYSLNGSRSAAQQGLVVIRYADGTSRKVYKK